MLEKICDYIGCTADSVVITGDAGVVHVEVADAWRPGLDVNVRTHTLARTRTDARDGDLKNGRAAFV